jgi:hypothetical protein
VRKYIKNKPRIVSALLSAEDQKSVSLTENDLLAHGDAVTEAAKDKDVKTPPSKAGKPAAKKTSGPRPAAGGGGLGNRKP